MGATKDSHVPVMPFHCQLDAGFGRKKNRAGDSEHLVAVVTQVTHYSAVFFLGPRTSQMFICLIRMVCSRQPCYWSRDVEGIEVECCIEYVARNGKSQFGPKTWSCHVTFYTEP